MFYDFCRDNYWCGLVRDRFQTKLSTIAVQILHLFLNSSSFLISSPQQILIEWGVKGGSCPIIVRAPTNLLKDLADESKSKLLELKTYCSE